MTSSVPWERVMMPWWFGGWSAITNMGAIRDRAAQVMLRMDGWAKRTLTGSSRTASGKKGRTCPEGSHLLFFFGLPRFSQNDGIRRFWKNGRSRLL